MEARGRIIFEPYFDQAVQHLNVFYFRQSVIVVLYDLSVKVIPISRIGYFVLSNNVKAFKLKRATKYTFKTTMLV